MQAISVRAWCLVSTIGMFFSNAPAIAQHWAFQPVRKSEPPIDSTGWAAHPIDRFVAAAWQAQRLNPVQSADQRALLRRVTFDLIGLPPTPAEIIAFLADQSADAFSRVVERLLASPQYGERWGRHWMDVVRYADTAGDNADYPVPEARLYRDYIIDSFNADKPYDRFVQEQLAGDILAKSGPQERFAERVIATTYLALSRRYLTAPYEHFHLTLEDSIDTTGRAFLGLTLRCARCHDHKFDPVTKSDYYALYGIFASTQYPYAGSEELVSQKFPRQHFVPLVPGGQAQSKMQAYRERVQRLQAEITKLEKDDPLAKQVKERETQSAAIQKQLQDRSLTWFRGVILRARVTSLNKQRDEVNGKLQQKLAKLRQEMIAVQRPGAPPEMPIAYAVSEGKPADAPVQVMGEPDKLGPVVPRGAPKFLAGGKPFTIANGGSGRLELARWITDASNPLFARVMVNRIWQHHFGKGLVATPSNFGARGEPPTHPELLDYLAARFVESGWSIKAMHRLIVSSKTYQLSSKANADSIAKDPANQYYWRFDRRRLDAEAIRDAMLAISGNLDCTRPGSHPFPAFTAWTWTQHQPFKDSYPSKHRSVYLMTQRLQRHPYLCLFDGPDTNTTTEARGSSTVPSQALFLMNNAFVREQARGLARRIATLASADRARLSQAFEMTVGHTPAVSEMERALDFLERFRRELVQARVPGADIELEAWSSIAKVLFASNEFVYVD